MGTKVGTSLGGRYEILEAVGQGGMSTVYKAKDTVLGRFVAIKVLHKQFSQDHEFLVRFRREAQSAASLIHPNIVTVYDTGQEDGTHYIIMEYVEGQQVKELIRERGPLPTEMALDIGKQVAQALAYAHRREIIHRDIKPHNMILSRDGRVCVTDFGIARATSLPGITQDGTVLGTVQYISPEQAKGEVADAQSDIYSLGVCLYEMVTGTQPFRGDNPVEVALKHVQDDPPPMQRHGEPVDPAVEQLVMKAMAKDKTQRHVTADDLVDDLSALLARPEAPPADEQAAERTRVMKAVRIKSRKPSAKKPAKTPTPARPVAPRPLPVSDGTYERPDRPSPLMAWGVLGVLVVLVAALGYFAVTVVPPLVRKSVARQAPKPPPMRLDQVAPVAAKDFDPQGTDGSENPDLVDQAIDADPGTAWHTDIYNSEAFGNLKDGVGIYFDLGRSVNLARIKITAMESGYNLVVKGSEDAPEDVTKWTELARKNDMPDRYTFNLTNAKCRYVLLWITKLAANPSGDRYKVDVAEVLFYEKKL